MISSSVLNLIASRLDPSSLERVMNTPLNRVSQARLWNEAEESEREAIASLIQNEIDSIYIQDEDILIAAKKVLKNACAQGKTSLVSRSLELGIEPEDECLSEAIAYDRRDVVRLLLEDGRVDPSAAGNYAIKIVADRCDLETAALLLRDKRVDPSVVDREDACNQFWDLVSRMR